MRRLWVVLATVLAAGSALAQGTIEWRASPTPDTAASTSGRPAPIPAWPQSRESAAATAIAAMLAASLPFTREELDRYRSLLGEHPDLILADARITHLARDRAAAAKYRAWLSVADKSDARRAWVERNAARAERGEDYEQGAGEPLRDCPDCPEMVIIPAGRFQMGSQSNEAQRLNDEGPVRQVSIRSFAMGKYEVTVGQFRQFVRETNHSWPGSCRVSFSQDDRHPVVCVSWNDAKAHAEWLSRKTGKSYRLPSEAEWEYAARAGTTTPFHFGATITPDQANYDGNYTYAYGPKGIYRRGTTPVGSFPTNAFGLADVHGNAWEWVEDCYNSSYAGAPMDGTAWVSGSCSTRVLRGGSWFTIPRFVRSADRGRDTTDNRFGYLGFRVARTLQ